MSYTGHADTGASMMDTPQFVDLAQALQDRWPDAKLVKNSVGNLLVFVDDVDVGYLDLFDGELVGWDDGTREG
jgi:hypothetical protein